MNIMSNDDVLTLKAAVLHILNRAGGTLDKYRIYKALYFANKEHLNRYGRLITSDTFFALPFGPVPTKLADVFDSLQHGKPLQKNDKELFCPIMKSIVPCKFDADNYFTAEELPDLDELSDSDIECLNIGLNKCVGRDFDEIKEESHDEAWKKAFAKPNHKSIDVLDMVDDSNQDMKEYVLDNMYCC